MSDDYPTFAPQRLRLAAIAAGVLVLAVLLFHDDDSGAWNGPGGTHGSGQGYIYGNQFSSGETYGNGAWSHYGNHGGGGYGVGGDANGCIYAGDWSNC